MKITRSFSKKIQLKPYEPIEVFCAVEMELPTDEGSKELVMRSRHLAKFCNNEVEKTLNTFREVDKQNAQSQGKLSAQLEAEGKVKTE